MARLVILDLNGFLIHRIHERDVATIDPDVLKEAKYCKPFYGWLRPQACEFLDLLFQHFTVAIWTSAQEHNAMSILNLLLPEYGQDKFLFVWGQEKCNSNILSEADWADEQTKPPKKRKRRKRWLFTKPLARVWEAFPQFDKTNTLLVDDSIEKAIENPPGLHYCPPTWHLAPATPLIPLAGSENYSIFQTILQWRK
jgi:hypothetical protein